MTDPQGPCRQIFTPEHYSAFRCLASACPDSCCKEWEVDVDLPTANRYRMLPGILGDRLREVLRFEGDAAVMTITDGRCPMWREDGLCEIHAQLGHGGLCRVCREFPRLRHDYGDFVELGLELSCPEAARLILTADPKPMTAETVPGGEVPEYEVQAMTVLRQSREQALSFLENPDYPPGQTLAILLIYAAAVQNQLDIGAPADFTPETFLADARRGAASGAMADIFAFFRNLEILTPQWRARLSAAPVSAALPPMVLALMRYFTQRYWLQAVSDFDLLGRVKFALTACLVVCALGGDFIQTAQLFSKEIENDPDNMDALLDAAYTHPAFADAALLGLLLAY